MVLDLPEENPIEKLFDEIREKHFILHKSHIVLSFMCMKSTPCMAMWILYEL